MLPEVKKRYFEAKLNLNIDKLKLSSYRDLSEASFSSSFSIFFPANSLPVFPDYNLPQKCYF